MTLQVYFCTTFNVIPDSGTSTCKRHIECVEVPDGVQSFNASKETHPSCELNIAGPSTESLALNCTVFPYWRSCLGIETLDCCINMARRLTHLYNESSSLSAACTWVRIEPCRHVGSKVAAERLPGRVLIILYPPSLCHDLHCCSSMRFPN